MGDIHCPVEATLGLIGGKYKALILWRLTDGTLRFSELQRIVTAATPKTLTTQLRELERDGLVARRVYAVVPPKVEYSLTERGRSIRPCTPGAQTICAHQALNPTAPCSRTKRPAGAATGNTNP